MTLEWSSRAAPYKRDNIAIGKNGYANSADFQLAREIMASAQTDKCLGTCNQSGQSGWN